MSSTTSPKPPRDRSDFEIAIICALPLEAECVLDALDNRWETKKYGRAANDTNAYTLGSMGEHNIVCVHLPGMGTVRAAQAASNLEKSFPNIRLILVVGICGGMPYSPQKEEILLGDVIISKALISYTFGRQYPQSFQRTTDLLNTLAPASDQILGLLNKIATRQNLQTIENNAAMFLRAIQEKSPITKHPGIENDVLYQSSYTHRHHPPTKCTQCKRHDDICQTVLSTDCDALGCKPAQRVPRKRLHNPSTVQPMVHFGIMGSGDTVMKSGRHRDALAKQEGIIALEMEGAGVWRNGHTIVIKGVSDYADSHKRKSWQRYAAATAAACTKALLVEWTPAEKQPNPAEQRETNEYLLVPKQRIKRLFGREEELSTIDAFFQKQDSRPRILVLLAMGGQGKTQIALEYCQRAYHHYKGVFWVNATSIPTITQSLVAVAQELDPAMSAGSSDDQAKVDFVLRTLHKWKERWLMVFDNCDDSAIFSELDEYIPQVGSANVLFTSRHRDLEHLGEILEVQSMSADSAVELLLHRYRGIDIENYMAEGTAIVDRLGRLALAIDQASAYMQYIRLPIDQLGTFLPRYGAQRDKILKHTTSNFWKYTKVSGHNDREVAISAFTTWEMSFQHLLDIQRESDNVSHFLTLSAFFGPTFVGETLFNFHWLGCKVQPPWMKLFVTQTSPLRTHVPRDSSDRDRSSSAPQDMTSVLLSEDLEAVKLDNPKVTWQPDRFWDLIYQAFQLSLLQSVVSATPPRERSFLFHPLIRDWLQLRLQPEGRRSFTREAADVVASSIQVVGTSGNDRTAEDNAILLMHMDSVLSNDREYFPPNCQLGHDISSCDSATSFADFYREQGRYNVSLALSRAESETRQRVQGNEDWHTLFSLDNLAIVLGRMGRYGEAEKVHRELLQTRQRLLGPEHKNTLICMDNVAGILEKQGKHDEAAEMTRTALDGMLRVLGPEDEDTLGCMNNMATLLEKLGEPVEAESMYHQALEGMEKMAGREHPLTLNLMSNLALLLSGQGKYIEAEDMYRREIAIRDRVQGMDNPETLISLGNLGQVLSNQGKYEEAEQIQRTVVEGRSRTFGQDNRSTLMAMNNLATILADMGRRSEAGDLQLQIVETSLTALGRHDVDTQFLIDGIQIIWRNSGRPEAELQDILNTMPGYTE